MVDPQAFAGRAVLVTGAGSGIGQAVALTFARHGAKVAVADISFSGADETARLVRDLGAEALAIEADVSSPQAVGAMVEQAERDLGPVTILVNNAGVREVCPFLELPFDRWAEVMGVNLTGPFLCSQAVARRLVALGQGGVIVNIASVAGLAGMAERPAYVSSKHGLVGLTKAMAMELGPRGIRVVAINPGGVVTPIHAGQDLSGRAATYPLRRMGEAQEMADLVAFLASDQAAFITGASVTIDGGLLAGILRPGSPSASA